MNKQFTIVTLDPAAGSRGAVLEHSLPEHLIV
jgi:hypothetical protein